MTEHEFEMLVQATLADHPDWVGSAIRGVNAGVAGALSRTQAEYGRMNAGFLAAMALANPKRLSKESLEMLNEVAARAIPVRVASPGEKEFLGNSECPTARLFRAIRDDGYICMDCAQAAGAEWPDEHVATWSVSTCVICGGRKDTCAVSDWEWPGVSMKGRREF